MTEDFYLASVPEKFQVLGFVLHPLSLGHVILLHRIGSSFVTGGEPTISDLASSVLVCIQSYADGIKAIEDPHLNDFMIRWHNKLAGMNWLVRLGLKKPRQIDFQKEAGEFIRYLKFHTRVPNYSYKEGDFAQMDCPEPQLIKVTLMRDMGFREDEILDRSWLLCLWDHVTLKALNGHVRLVDSDALAEAQARADKLAALIAEGKVKVNRGPA